MAMNNEELRDLLKNREAQAVDAQALIERRPHHNRMFNETMRLACLDLRAAVAVCRDGLDGGYADEEMVKATLYARYSEFLRCRDRITQDFAEIDAMGLVAYAYSWFVTAGDATTRRSTHAFASHNRATAARERADRNREEDTRTTAVFEIVVNQTVYDALRVAGAEGRRVVFEGDGKLVKEVL